MRLPLSTSLLAVVVAAPLAGMDSHSVGPRAMGMGGAGTAVADDHTAQYYNPAMFGFFSRTGEEGARLDADPNYIGRKDWGLGLVDATVELDIRGSLANYVQQIADVDFDRLSNLGSDQLARRRRQALKAAAQGAEAVIGDLGDGGGDLALGEDGELLGLHAPLAAVAFEVLERLEAADPADPALEGGLVGDVVVLAQADHRRFLEDVLARLAGADDGADVDQEERTPRLQQLGSGLAVHPSNPTRVADMAITGDGLVAAE